MLCASITFESKQIPRLLTTYTVSAYRGILHQLNSASVWLEMWATNPYSRVYTFVQNGNTNEIKWLAYVAKQIFKRSYVDDLSTIIYIYIFL